MSSNLKVNNILPSTGVNIGLGTASGTLNVDGGCKVQVGTALTLGNTQGVQFHTCLLYTYPSPRDYAASRMPSSA